MFNKLFCNKTIVLLLVGILSPLPVLAESENQATSTDEAQQSVPMDEVQQSVQMDEVQRFSNTINQIKKYYVKPVSDKELFDNAIRGMLSGLDQHSSYINEDDFQELQTSTNGEFSGLGIEVTKEDGVHLVASF